MFAIAFSPDGKMLATGCYDRTEPADRPPQARAAKSLFLWDVKTGKEICSFPAHRGRLFSLAFSPDGKTLVSTGADGKIRFWDPIAKEESHPFKEPLIGCTCVVFAPDGKTLASVGEKRIYLWDAATGKKKLPEFGSNQFAICKIAFAPDGKALASTGGTDRAIHLWDAATGTEIRSFPGESGNFIEVAFSPTGKTIAAGGNDPTIRFWGVAKGAPRRVVNPQGVAFAFSPDGRSLASCDANNRVRLWEMATRKQRGELGAHPNWIHCLAFAPDGKTLASGSEDATVQIWDVVGPLKNQPVRLSPQACEALWNKLADENPSTAYRAIRTLSADPGPSLLLLKKRLRPLPGMGPAREATVLRLIRDLDDDAFAVRERATKSLEKLGLAAEKPLRRALQDPPSLEVRLRVQRLLEKLEVPDDEFQATPHELPLVRAVEVLEIIGSSEACQVLESLTHGAPGARLAREAKLSLERLARRSVAKP